MSAPTTNTSAATWKAVAVGAAVVAVAAAVVAYNANNSKRTPRRNNNGDDGPAAAEPEPVSKPAVSKHAQAKPKRSNAEKLVTPIVVSQSMQSDVMTVPPSVHHPSVCEDENCSLESSASPSSYPSSSDPSASSSSSSISPNPATHSPESVISLVRSSFPLWTKEPSFSSLPESAIHAKPLLGGSSNFLWLVTLKDNNALPASVPRSIVVRFYGASAGAFIQRDKEVLFADLLSSAGVGATIYHHFEAPVEGRVEKFIHGRTLVQREFTMSKFNIPLAGKLADLHSIEVPLDQPDFKHLKKEKWLTPTWWKWFKLSIHARHHLSVEDATASDLNDPDLYSLKSQNALYQALGLPVLDKSWTLAKLNALDFSNPASLPAEIRDNKWYREIEWLDALLNSWTDATPRDTHGNQLANPKPKQVQYLKNCVALEPLALCHNDLNPGNVLFEEDGNEDDAPEGSVMDHEEEESKSSSSLASNPIFQRLTVIDFEYAAFNSPAYDLANFVCEFALDYTLPHWPFHASKHNHFFPKQDKMMEVIKAYAEEKIRLHNKQHPKAKLALTASNVAHLYVSTLTHLMASHLTWALWGCIQSGSAAHSSAEKPSWDPASDFKPPAIGFLEYSETRWELYNEFKRLWLTHNYADSPYPPPPNWQMMSCDEDWNMWLEQLEFIHDEFTNVQLKSAQRHQKQGQIYQQKAKQRK